ncbi:MAG: prephenate dehydrogenase [Clostridiales bacterium]|jgi:prephenate dehydrogenase|nr:prephenate dehydrogenase [Clostridiales bacterium]
MIDQSKRFLIVGLGLLGGSYAKALKQKGYSVYAITRSQNTIDYALARGWIDGGSTEEDPALIGQADFVVFGLYPHTMIEWIARNQTAFQPGAILTDVSGVKCNVVDVIQEGLRQDVEFIGSHPMAGKEVSGVQHSDETMFRSANFIITPTEKNTERGIGFARELAELLEFQHITSLSIEEHDEMIGFVSQLTHAVAVSLMNTNDNAHLKDYTGDSFRDLTRIAKINESLWSELFFLNKKNLVREIDEFIASLNDLKQKIADEDDEGIRKLFIQSTKRRKYFDE